MKAALAIAMIGGGARITTAEYLDSLEERARFTRAWLSFFERYDLLLTPTMQLTAFPVGEVMPAEIDGQTVDPERENWCAFLYGLNLTGCPAASVPCGVDEDGLPIGLQISGKSHQRTRSVRLGRAGLLGSGWDLSANHHARMGTRLAV